MTTNFYNIKINSIDYNRLVSLLKEWDGFFVPSLSSYVNHIEEYAYKIYRNADIIEAYNIKGEIIGLLCIYLNQEVGYLTHLAVNPEYQKQGIGNELLNVSEQIALKKGINKIRLECFKQNQKGVNFYMKNSYKKIRENEKIVFEKCLKEDIYPKVSIVCLTYNQKKFIRQCLDGFVMQKTNFKFEVLIHDDASTDGTADIIREYEKKYPDIIRPIYQVENKFSQGIDIHKNFIYPYIQGKYVALCEGDDYWTDPNKLQKQVDFLELHPEYSGCFHPVKVIWEKNEHKDSIYPTKKKMRGKKFVTKEDLLNYNYIQTNSVVYRWRFIEENIQDYFPDGILPGDLYLHLLHAQIGNIAFLPDIMAVYRKNEGGIWYDEKSRAIKYGLAQVKFQYNVWKNFTDSSEKYLNETLLPFMKGISNIYYENLMFDKLEILKETYGDLYLKALCKQEKIIKKYKKYKKLSNIFITTTIISIIIIILLCSKIFL